MIRWPIPYDPGPSSFEIVGRYIGQTVLMERFIDLILLEQGTKPHYLKRANLSRKIDDVRAVIERPELALNEWHDLPDMMLKVARNWNLFAHRMFERGAMPNHYGQSIPYESLSDEDLAAQEREAFMASEICRQLVARLTLTTLNPGRHFGRSDPDWTEILERHARLSAEGR